MRDPRGCSSHRAAFTLQAFDRYCFHACEPRWLARRKITVLLWLAACSTAAGQFSTDPCIIPPRSGVANGGIELCKNGNQLGNFEYCETTCNEGYSAAAAPGYPPGDIVPFCTFGDLYPPTYQCVENPCALPTRMPGSDYVVHPPEVCEGIDRDGLVPPSSACLAKCKSGWTPSIASLSCSLGVLSPDTFECSPSPCSFPLVQFAPSACEESAVPHLGRCTPNCQTGYRAVPQVQRPEAAWRFIMWEVSKVRGSEAKISVNEIFLFKNGEAVAKAGVVAIPTGGTSPTGEEPAKAVDDALAKWTQNGLHALVLEFPSPVFVDSFSFQTNSEDPDWDPLRWQLMGSLDGIDWTLLHDQASADSNTPVQLSFDTETFGLLTTSFVVGDRVRLAKHITRVKAAFDSSGVEWNDGVEDYLGEILTITEVPLGLNLPSSEALSTGVVRAGPPGGTSYLFPQSDILEPQTVLSCYEGSYTPETFVCEERPCDAPAGVGFAYIPHCEEGWVIESTQVCTTRCMVEQGYRTSHDVLHCDKGILEPPTFDCAMGRCSAPKTEDVPWSGIPTCEEGLKVEAGTACTTVCQWGYTPSVAKLQCAASVFYPPTFTCLEDPCSPPAGVTNGATWSTCVEGNVIVAGTRCTSNCDNGYTPNVTFLDCSRGKLSPSTFACSPSDCHIKPVENGARFPCREGNILKHGMTCTTQCKFGFIQNYATLLCQYGNFTPPAFLCEEASCMIPVDLIADVGEPPCEEGVHSIKTGEICTPRCRFGYIPTEAQLSCDMGTLQPETFECLGQPCSVPPASSIANGHPTSLCAESATQIAHGGNCTTQCAEGYIPLDAKLRCSATRLSPPTFTCLGTSVYEAAQPLAENIVHQSATAKFVNAPLGDGKTLSCYQDTKGMRLACVAILASLAALRSGPELHVISERVMDVVMAPVGSGTIAICYTTRDRPLGVCQLLRLTAPDNMELTIVGDDAELVSSGDAVGVNIVRHLSITSLAGGGALLCYQLGSIKVVCRTLQASPPLIQPSTPAHQATAFPDRLATSALEVVSLSAYRAALCLADSALDRQGVCYLLSIEGGSANAIDSVVFNDGATTHLAVAELGTGRALLCYSDWAQEENGVCAVLGSDASGKVLEVGPRTTTDTGITRYTRLATMSTESTEQRVLLYYQLSTSLGHSPAVCITITAPPRGRPIFKALNFDWFVDDQMLMYPNHDNGTAFSDAAAGWDDRVVLAPFDANSICVVNASAPSVTLINISSHSALGKKYAGAAAVNGTIVFAPYDADNVGVFDMSYESSDGFSTVDVSTEVTGISKYLGAASTLDGYVIFAPCQASGVGVFDATTHSFYSVDIAKAHTNCSFNAATVTPNGNVIFTPCDMPFIGVFAPPYSDSSRFSTVNISSDLGALHNSTELFRGAVLAPNGKVIFCPGSALQVGIFDPDTNQYQAVDISMGYSESAWRGAVVSSDGRIVFPPSVFGGDMAVFNLVTDEFSTFSAGTAGDLVGAYVGGAVGAHGRMVLPPTNSSNVGLLFLEVPTVLAEVTFSAREDVQTGIAWNLGLSSLSKDTALACYADSFKAESGRCKVLWTPSYQTPGEGPIVCHGSDTCA